MQNERQDVYTRVTGKIIADPATKQQLDRRTRSREPLPGEQGGLGTVRREDASCSCRPN
jgi:hypothetical protein